MDSFLFLSSCWQSEGVLGFWGGRQKREGLRKKRLRDISSGCHSLRALPAVGPGKWEGKSEPRSLGRPSWGRKTDLIFDLHPLLLTTLTSGCHSGNRQPQSGEDWRC